MNELQIGIISLIKAALTEERTSLPDNFDWEAALKTAKKHQIIPMLYYGIKNSDITPPVDVMQTLERSTLENIFVSQNQLFALNELYKAFDENKIDYLPLKGSVLKYIYPKPELRPMGDADILIKEEQYPTIKKLMQDMDYNEKLESDHELIWDKKGTLHIELHKRLIPSYNKDYYAYYKNAWSFAICEKNCRYNMRNEDNYIYLFTHYTKHYRDGGIGIRHMTDLYVFEAANTELDYNYIVKELKKLQLFEFYKNTKHTLDVWFCEKQPDVMSDFITDKIFSSGSYGTHTSRKLSFETRISGKSQNNRFLRRAFPTYSQMRLIFPILKRCPVLLPFLWVVRWVRAILFRRNKIKTEYNNIKNISSSQINEYSNELKYVGLGFDED